MTDKEQPDLDPGTQELIKLNEDRKQYLEQLKRYFPSDTVSTKLSECHDRLLDLITEDLGNMVQNLELLNTRLLQENLTLRAIVFTLFEKGVLTEAELTKEFDKQKSQLKVGPSQG